MTFTNHILHLIHRKVDYVNFPALPLHGFDFNVELDYNSLENTKKDFHPSLYTLLFLKKGFIWLHLFSLSSLTRKFLLFHGTHTFSKSSSQKRKYASFLLHTLHKNKLPTYLDQIINV